MMLLMTLDRRSFCAGLGALAVLPGCRSNKPSDAIAAADPPQKMTIRRVGSGLSTVIEVRWAQAINDRGVVDKAALLAMVNAGVEGLDNGSTLLTAMVGGKRKVGLKVNSVTSQSFTHPELAGVVAKRLVDAGGSPETVTVWDRDSAVLAARGYQLDPGAKGGYRCIGSDAATSKANQSAEVAGVKVHFSPLLSEAQALINLAALKDHSMAGVSLSLKNNFGVIHRAQELHGDFYRGSGCEPGISQLAARPEIRDRLQLAMIDALFGVCEGGPGPTQTRYVFRYGGILLSRDPVALDQLGRTIIETRRAELKLVPLAKRNVPNPSPAKHIENAAAAGVSPKT